MLYYVISLSLSVAGKLTIEMMAKSAAHAMTNNDNDDDNDDDDDDVRTMMMILDPKLKTNYIQLCTHT